MNALTFVQSENNKALMQRFCSQTPNGVLLYLTLGFSADTTAMGSD